MPIQDDYRVRLSAFQGPLDLLLYLVRRAEVDIQDIPIVQITDQYFQLLNQIEHVDIDQAGEFLVMAATLIEIKSRTLAPRPAAEDGEETDADSLEQDDPRYELIQQLLSYQKYRTAADDLDRLRLEFSQRHRASAAALIEESDEAPDPLELEDAHVLDLFQAYERIIEAIDVTRLGEHTVEFDDTPLSLHQDDLMDRLRRSDGCRLRLEQVLAGRNRMDMIGLFLALLELARQRSIRVVQESVSDSIVVELAEDHDDVQQGETVVD